MLLGEGLNFCFVIYVLGSVPQFPCLSRCLPGTGPALKCTVSHFLDFIVGSPTSGSTFCKGVNGQIPESAKSSHESLEPSPKPSDSALLWKITVGVLS